jgi:uncharacterized protein (DUF1330 family)
MKIWKVISPAILGVALWIGQGAVASAAQGTAVTAPAYYVAEFEITDPEGMKPYSAKVESTFKPYGGHFIVRGGNYVPLEGTAPKRKRVVIEFESVEKAMAWYNSPAYTELRKIRQRSAHTDVYVVEGVAGQ